MPKFTKIEIVSDPDSSMGVYYIATMDDFEPCVLAADELLGMIAMALFGEKPPRYLSRPKTAIAPARATQEAERWVKNLLALRPQESD